MAHNAAVERRMAPCAALLARGQAEAVLNLADDALFEASGSVQAHLWRGLALMDLGRLGDARDSFERALALDAACVPALINRAAILRRQGLSEEALAACDAAIALDPDFAAARCNRGLALNDLDRPQEALQEFDRAIALAPDFAAAHGNRGKTLHALARFGEALEAYRRVIAIEPNSAQAYLNASHTCLTIGQFEQGFAWYEWRKRQPPASARSGLEVPLWAGQAVAGKTVLLQAEQGLGDSIQFCRYARLVQQRGARVVLAVQEPLVRLLQSLGSDIEVRAVTAQPATGLDYYCPLLSLPLAFRTTLDSIPATVPYLSAEPERIAHWRAVIGSRGVRIGINWQGNRASPADRGRSLPLALFESIATLPEVRLISLQHGAGTEQIGECRQRFEVHTMPAEFEQGSNAFLDSAALLESLDLVITSDTALAHLAGAIGRPTWLALPWVADWRWLESRTDSPWYPSMRLFRQSERGRWHDVFALMRSQLLAALSSS
jgi:tetratricopeptide (TPR) repeat protein